MESSGRVALIQREEGAEVSRFLAKVWNRNQNLERKIIFERGPLVSQQSNQLAAEMQQDLGPPVPRGCK